MAFRFGRVVIIETPKTGTHFIRQVLKTRNIPFTHMMRRNGGPGVHWPSRTYDIPSGFRVFATMRHPSGLIRSFWRYCRGIQQPPQLRWSPITPLFPVHDEFDDYIRSIIGKGPVVSKMLELMAADHPVLRQESLTQDFYKLLCEEGYAAKTGKWQLRDSPLENVSRDWGEKWNPKLKEEFERVEHRAIERWY